MVIHLWRGSLRASGVSRRACDRYPRRAPEFPPRPGRRPGVSVWPCTAWGLSCPGSHPPGGGLLPRLFTLTATPVRARHGGLFSVTLSIDRDFRPGPPRLFRGMLPCGVRTFLSRRSGSDHLPAPNLSYFTPRPKLKTRFPGQNGKLPELTIFPFCVSFPSCCIVFVCFSPFSRSSPRSADKANRST